MFKWMDFIFYLISLIFLSIFCFFLVIIVDGYLNWIKTKNRKVGFWNFFISKNIQFQELKEFFNKFLGKTKKSSGHVWKMTINRSNRKWKYELSIHINNEVFGGNIFVSPTIYYKVSSEYQTKVEIKYIVGKFDNKIYIRSIKILDKLPPCIKDYQ